MGKPTKGNQKGAQGHAEGQHGGKTHRAMLDGMMQHDEEQVAGGRRAASDPNREGTTGALAAEHHEKLLHEGSDGGHRLMEQRAQADEAEKNSEKNRLMIDVEKHKHDRSEFVIPGRPEEHPRG